MAKNTIIIHSFDKYQCGFVRFHNIQLIMHSQYGMGVFVEHHTHVVQDGDLLNDTQSVVIQRPFTENMANLAKWYSQYRRTYMYNIVFDIDDVLWELKPEYKKVIMEIAEVPNFVVCSTRRLAREWKKISSRPAIVVPNGVQAWTCVPKQEVTEDLAKPKVFYGGSSGHSNDFSREWIEFLRDGIENNKIELHLMVLPDTLKDLESKIVVHDITTPVEYLNTVNRINPDFYIAPLEETLLNNCKSDLKVKEAAALGCVFFGSKLSNGPYNYIDDAMTVSNGGDIAEKFCKLCKKDEYNRCRGILQNYLKAKNWNTATFEFTNRWLEGYLNGKEV